MNKKRKTIKFYKRQVLHLNICMGIMFLLVLFLGGIITYTEGFLDRFFVETYDREFVNVSVDFSELNDKEQLVAYNVLKKVKLIYLTKQREVIFTKNISKDYTGSGNAETILGFNTWNNKNYIKYTGNDAQLRQTICHEFLHSFFKRGDEESHDVVYDLARQGVCYNK